MTQLTKVPVTVITGFLGSGKTTLIRHLITNAQGRRLAVLVNEFGEVGVDGEILKSCADENCPSENIVELANGCICCTIRDDLIVEVLKLLAGLEVARGILTLYDADDSTFRSIKIKRQQREGCPACG